MSEETAATATDTTITVRLTHWEPVTQRQWDDFCHERGLALQEDGHFLGGGLRAGCERGLATFSGPEAAAAAAAFWICFGGRMSADRSLDEEIDGILRARPCMASTEKIALMSFGLGTKLQDWVAWTAGDVVPLRALAGLTVSLGTKDGVVYEDVTVSSFDRRTGELTLTGGVFSHLYRDSAPVPLVTGAILHAHDIARGFIHPASAS